MNGVDRAVRPRPGRGRWLVVAITAVGIGAGLVSLTWWRYIERQWHGAAHADGRPDAPDEQRFGTLAEKVNDALAHDRGKAVLEEVEQLIARYPGYAPAHRMLGQVQLGLKSLDRAYASFARSLELDAAQPEVHRLSGTICMELKRPEGALRHYVEAVDLAPTDVSLRLHLYQCRLALGDVDTARVGLERLVAHDSSSHKALAMLATIAFDEGESARSLELISRSIEVVPIIDREDEVAYIVQKARILRSIDRADEGLTLLDHLGASERLQPAVMAEIALGLAARDRPDRAALIYEEALIDAPTDWRLAAEAARWWAKAGEIDKSKVNVDRVRSLNPNAGILSELETLLR